MSPQHYTNLDPKGFSDEVLRTKTESLRAIIQSKRKELNVMEHEARRLERAHKLFDDLLESYAALELEKKERGL